MNTTVKIKAKTKAGTAFVTDGGEWFNVDPDGKAKSYFDKVNKGDNVNVEYTKDKGRNMIDKISKVEATTTSNATQKTETTTTAKAEAPKSTTGFACEVCGKELKDGKFKKCFVCNKNGATKKAEPKPAPTTANVEKAVEQKPKETFVPKAGGYGSPSDILGKSIGCAVGASAQIMSNPSIELPDNTPETFVKVAKMIADELLDYMQKKQL